MRHLVLGVPLTKSPLASAGQACKREKRTTPEGGSDLFRRLQAMGVLYGNAYPIAIRFRICKPHFVNYTCGMSEKLAKQLRAAISKSGQSANSIAKATGVPQPTITRFLAGSDMRMSTASVLAEYLGLELQGKKKRPPKR